MEKEIVDNSSSSNINGSKDNVVAEYRDPCVGPRCVHVDAVFKECRNFLVTHAGDEGMGVAVFKTIVGSKDFLQKVFILFDDDGDELLDQDLLVTRIRARLTGAKESHLAEVVVTAVYAHAFDQLIDADTFCNIFATKELLDRVFRLIDQDGDGIVTIKEVMEFLANLTNAKPRDELTVENVQYLEKLFRESARDGDEIHLEDFRQIVKSKNIFFTERVFSVFDRDGSGTVSLQEFLDAINKFAGQSPDIKINFLFRIYDLDGDGLIQHNELRHVMKACMEENGMKFSEEQIEELTTALFEDADPSGTGAITFEALKAQLAKHDGLLENLCTSIERWLVPPKPERRTWSSRLHSILPHWMSWRYYRNNYVFLTFLFLYVGANLALFASRAYEKRHENAYVIVARACGQCLNFTCMMVLVFMLRNCLTWLRTHGFNSILPLDDHIFFHKLTGAFIFVYSVVHTVMHVCNFHIVVAVPNSTFTVVDFLFTAKPGLFGLVPGWASITGDLLVLILVIMVLCSLSCVRKSGYFEVFYWTHQLYVAFWVLLILHGPHFWKWFVGPAAIYVLERIVRMFRLSSGHGRTIITEGVLLPSKVTHLVIRRPPSFVFHPGDYIFIRIPAIASSEWHPFTLSSAPEQEDIIWLHIRAVGEWTKKLYDYVEKQQERLPITPPPSVTIAITDQDSKSNGISDSIALVEAPQKSVHLSPFLVEKVSYVNNGYDVDETIDEDIPNVPPTTPASLAPSSPGTPAVVTLRPRFPIHKPLAASQSMPDVEARVKKRQKLMRSRELPRSASAKSFDEKALAQARNSGSNGTLYRRHRQSVAKSFKYLRHKPNVIQLSPLADETGKAEICAAVSTPLATVRAETSSIKKVPLDSLILTEATLGKPLEVYIDGPFGAPSSHIFRAQHAVLIATGIGVTPFASILQSIMCRYWKERHTCPRCSYSWTSDIPQGVMNLRKVDFFWINRDQRSFEWFVNLLSQLEIEQAELGGAMERFLDMYMYITSALQRADMKALGLQLALDLLHEKDKRDLITGLKTRTQAGRPNWNKVFKQISEQRKGKVTVFYCGPPELGRILQVKCDEFGFTFRKESF